MEFLPQDIERYALAHTAEETAVLAELNRKTHLQVLQPRMLSGHLQGRVLSMMSQMIRPRRILEIGTYTGYSAICLAEGLLEGGKLYTVDVNEELEPMQQDYFKKAGVKDRIVVHYGAADAWIPTLKESWDLVFIDADKENYGRYFDLVLAQVRRGGWIVADNVLWSGKVAESPSPQDKETQALVLFNQKIQDDPRVENVLLPIRDGLMVMRKI